MRLRATVLLYVLMVVTAAFAREVPLWGLYQTSFTIEADSVADPYAPSLLTAVFTHADGDSVRVEGFCDGDGTYCLRFMPHRPGLWQWRTRSAVKSLDGHSGSLSCVEPTGRGPVRAGGDHEFRYADSTIYHPIGTTSYACAYGSDSLRTLTLRSLDEAGFNKLRFAVFPNSSVRDEPDLLPMGSNGDFDPAFFRRLESFIASLDSIGVQADLILFHPYDGGRWGYDRMDMDTNLRYLHYIVARLAAYPNVWWSLANEWNLLRARQPSDWPLMASAIADIDPYGHLRSVHGTTATYVNYFDPCYTHLSVQDHGPVATAQGAATVRNIFPKPVVFDEVCYEGDHERRWGRLTGPEMLQRMYTALIGGTYAGHGECYVEQPDYYTGNSFLARGGRFRGESASRVRFMVELLESLPAPPRLADTAYDGATACCGDGVYLVYLGDDTPAQWKFSLPMKADRFAPLKGGERFSVEVIDTWEMTTQTCPTVFEAVKAPGRRVTDIDGRTVPLPSRPGILLKITRVEV